MDQLLCLFITWVQEKKNGMGSIDPGGLILYQGALDTNGLQREVQDPTPNYMSQKILWVHMFWKL